MDVSESLQSAAVRETLEEAGVQVRLTGILRMEYSPKVRYCRLRVVFLAEPVDDTTLPKSIPCFESAGAVWVTAKEVASLPLRGDEPLKWMPYVAKGGFVAPLEMLTREGGAVSASLIGRQQ